jgi:hypothetical protein
MTALQLVQIEEWKIVDSAMQSTTSDQIGFRLRGNVYGHEKYSDGERITTSRIVRVEGRKVFCTSRVYLLGKPSSDFMDMLKTIRADFDQSDPLGPFLPAIGDEE